MSRAISRRSVIAALAAGAAVNVPVIAGTVRKLPDAAPPVSVDPDHLILDLGRRYDAALTLEDAAVEALQKCCDAYHAAEPEPPDALRHRVRDHYDFGFPLLDGTEHISDGEHGDFYSAAEIEMLRATRFGRPEQQARADAIIAAWDGHQSVCEAVSRRIGYDGAQTAYGDAVEARKAIGDAIVACRARTWQGLAVRARIVADLFGDDDDDEAVLPTDQKMMFAIVRDLARLEG